MTATQDTTYALSVTVSTLLLTTTISLYMNYLSVSVKLVRMELADFPRSQVSNAADKLEGADGQVEIVYSRTFSTVH